MSMSPEQTRARAQKAARARWHGDTAGTAAATAALERANEEAAITRHVEAITRHAEAIADAWAQARRPPGDAP
jgi:hypothetical protein